MHRVSDTRYITKKLPGKPDIVLPKYKTIIFIHGRILRPPDSLISQIGISKQKITMSKSAKELMIPEGLVMNKIYLIREQKVMLGRDLAELYGVETKVLNQSVKRNSE